MKRLVFRVRASRNYGWMVTRHRRPIAYWTTKVQAIADGRKRARRESPAQLVVHNRDGRIAFENTYGADPERHRG